MPGRMEEYSIMVGRGRSSNTRQQGDGAASPVAAVDHGLGKVRGGFVMPAPYRLREQDFGGGDTGYYYGGGGGGGPGGGGQRGKQGPIS